jgi:hypothetical protein
VVRTVDVDEGARRVRIALAEMGWTELQVLPMPDVTFSCCGRVGSVGIVGDWPPEAAPAVWMATYLSGRGHLSCWSCWIERCATGSRIPTGCVHGGCRHPDGPKRPPAELLRPRP